MWGGLKVPCGLTWGSEASLHIGSADLSVGTFGGTIFEWCNFEPNKLPVVNAVTFYFEEDTVGIRTLTGSDEDDDSLTFHLQQTPAHGEVVMINENKG